MDLAEITGGLVTGLAGGLFSGFLGVTSGGILVPLLILILGKEQHVAQGISLVAQIVPTSLSGVRNYSRAGHSVSLRWLVWLAAGFGVGGCIGALLAVHVPDRALQWCFVGYLVILLTVMILRSSRGTITGAGEAQEGNPLHWATLGAIGGIAGWSSGFLGIGGGLAITALMAGIGGLTQHRAQATSLAVTALPVTLPAAILYVQQGTELPWLAIAALIAGLWIGTDIGARFANRLSPERLRLAMILTLAALALFMAFKAWR